MSGIAKILFEMGFKVTGSDSREGPNTMRLKDLGIKVFIDHDAANVREADVVVYSSAIKNDNPEMIEARTKNTPIVKRAEMLSWIMDQNQIKIAVAGTHGKTTTSAMLAKVFEFSKLSPTYFIGCDMDYIDGNAKLGNGRYAITEADESDGSFLMLSPTIEIITNIENDHLENYGSMQALVDIFEEFAQKVPDTGFIALDIANNFNVELMKKVPKKYLTYGFNKEALYSAKNLTYKEFSSYFTLTKATEVLGEVELSVPGWQNILNSLGVFAIAMELGIDFNAISSALRTFSGARRRFQTVGEINDILIVDDYGHHPTEVKATLSAAKAGWPGKRLICIFQPHRYSRTMLLKEQFATAFKDADKVIITDIYAASEKPIPGISGKTIADGIKGQDVAYIKKKEKIPDHLLEDIQPNDLIITLGAGDIYTIAKELLTRLKMKNEISA